MNNRSLKIFSLAIDGQELFADGQDFDHYALVRRVPVTLVDDCHHSICTSSYSDVRSHSVTRLWRDHFMKRSDIGKFTSGIFCEVYDVHPDRDACVSVRDFQEYWKQVNAGRDPKWDARMDPIPPLIIWNVPSDVDILEEIEEVKGGFTYEQRYLRGNKTFKVLNFDIIGESDVAHPSHLLHWLKKNYRYDCKYPEAW